ncbi:hypothetical protein JCM1841_002696 [Sporobolomyces salmonicolor]
MDTPMSDASSSAPPPSLSFAPPPPAPESVSPVPPTLAHASGPSVAPATPYVASSPAPSVASTSASKAKAKAPAKPKAAVSSADGAEKPKKKRAPKKAPGEVGPGKSWRKGLKGNLAGVGLDPATAASIRENLTTNPPAAASSPSAAAPSARPSAAVGAPPKLATQFLPPQALEVNTPRPRRWIRSRMEFRSITGGTVRLPSWQGDSFSPYADHIASTQIDELASPPPPSLPSALASNAPNTSAPTSTPTARPPQPRASAAVSATHVGTGSPSLSLFGRALPPQDPVHPAAATAYQPAPPIPAAEDPAKMAALAAADAFNRSKEASAGESMAATPPPAPAYGP